MKLKEKWQKLIPGTSIVNNLIFVTISFILIGCFEKNDSLYIFFDDSKPHMLKQNDGRYKFWVNEEEFFLFEPEDKCQLSTQSEVKNEIVDIEWLSKTYRFDSQKVMKCPNVFIVEKYCIDSIRITPVKVYEGTE